MKKISTAFLIIVFVIAQSLPILALSNESHGYGYKKSEGESPPDLGFYAPLIEKYNGYYMGDPDEKKIYLTFDNGYEEGYTGMILDVLKEKQVPATFFLTGHYVDDEPELTKRMVNEGHIIGNDSDKHLDYTEASDDKVKKDLQTLDEKVKKVTSQDHVKFFRPAKGVFSERTLDLTNKLGYVNVFWTVALVDWNTGEKKGWEQAYRGVIDQIHPGAIVLLHAVSEDNAEALSHLIDDLRKRGYEFASLDELLWDELVPF